MKQEKCKTVVLVTTQTSNGMLVVASEAWKQYLKDATNRHEKPLRKAD